MGHILVPHIASEKVRFNNTNDTGQLDNLGNKRSTQSYRSIKPVF